MSKEECQTLFKTQNWYKLFVKRILLLRGPKRLEDLTKNGYGYDIISSAFAWSESQEGYDYWREISIEWRKLIRDVS